MAHDLLTRPDLYDEDYVAWADQQAALIRAGRLGELDLDNLAEEVKDLGKSERRRSESLAGRIIEHLLKLQFVPSPRDYAHWRGEVRNFRRQMRRDLARTLINELQTQIPDLIREELETLRERELVSDVAGAQAALDGGYTWSQINDPGFYPEPVDLAD